MFPTICIAEQSLLLQAEQTSWVFWWHSSTQHHQPVRRGGPSTTTKKAIKITYDSTYLLSLYSPHHSTTLECGLAPAALDWCCSTAGMGGCTSSWQTVTVLLLVDLHRSSIFPNLGSLFSWRVTLRLPDSNIPSKRMAQEAPMITPSYLYILSRWDGLMA
jgi:hypothetical protein